MKPPAKVTIDLDRLSQRTLALPVPADNYVALGPGKDGQVFLLKGPRVNPLGSDGPGLDVVRFDLEKRKTEMIVAWRNPVKPGRERRKAPLQAGRRLVHRRNRRPRQGRRRRPQIADAQVSVDPPAEWRQMYRETWRIERDFLYDPGYHGLDLAAAEEKYAPWVEGLRSRADLNVLFEEMLGELTLGHVFVGGGDRPEPPKVKGGLLGADFAVESGRYRFARVYDLPSSEGKR